MLKKVLKVNTLSKAVGRSENPGVAVLFGGHNLPPLKEIESTDLLKSGGSMALPSPGDNTPATIYILYSFLHQ